MKINLGSGFKRFDGFVNIDSDPKVNPDYVIDLDDVNIRLPFDDSTVEEVKAHHILEHIGDGFIPLMVELYRVCKHGAIVDIIVPHHFHEVYYGDPTHKRPITVNTMNMFGRKFCEDHIRQFNSSTGMAIRYNIDFEMLSYDFEHDQFYQPLIDSFQRRKLAGQVTPEEDFAFIRLMREAINVTMNTMIKLAAVKNYDGQST